MKPDRIFWGAGALILLLSVELGVQVFSLSRRLEEKDRTIRLLEAAFRGKSAGAGQLQAALSSEGAPEETNRPVFFPAPRRKTLVKPDRTIYK